MSTLTIFIQIFFSLFVIFVLHYFYNFLKETFSTKKTNDLVGFQVQKYQEIIQEMQNQNIVNFIPNQTKEIMKNELSELVLSY